MSERELSFLAETASLLKPKSTIIEIGSFIGKSARALADNSPSDCTIHCVDPWNYKILWSDRRIQVVDQTNFGMFYCNLGDHIKNKKVIPHIMTWNEFNADNIQADFIFIDGDHTTESVIFDIDKALLHIKPGGMIAGHDYNWESVQLAVDQFFPKIQLEDSIWAIRL